MYNKTDKRLSEGGQIMKKLLVIMMVLGCLFGCNKNNNIEGNEVFVTFDGYGLHGGVLKVNTTTTNEETVSIDLVSMGGNETVSDVLKKNEITNIEAVHENDVFEGWLIYKTEYTSQEDGTDVVVHTLLSNSLYTTEEVLDYKLADFNITIVAKWATLDSNLYFVEDDMMIDSDTSGAFVFNATDGVIQLSSADDKGLSESKTYVYWMEDGKCIADLLTNDSWQYFTDVVKEGASFSGWQLYEATNVRWSDKKSTSSIELSFDYDMDNTEFRYVVFENCKKVEGLKTTEDVVNMLNHSKVYYAEAVWK